MNAGKRFFAPLTATPLLGLALLGVSMTVSGQQVVVSVVQPEPASALNVPAVPLTSEQMERIFELKEQRKEEAARLYGGSDTSTGIGLEQLLPPATGLEPESMYPGVSSNLVIGRNNKNTRGNLSPNASTLAETTAVNEGRNVYSAGNFSHVERSSDGGFTWTDMPQGGGPADAPILCCDQEWVYDKGRGVFIRLALFINAGVTNGVIRLYVYRAGNLAAPACTYLIDQAGVANNILMDYPHSGLSKKHYYLSTNDIGGGGPQNARMRRLDLDSMASCVGAAMQTFALPSTTFGQRVFRPAQGGVYDTMYWAIKQTTTILRIYSWVEGVAAPTSTTRTIATTGTANALCAGPGDWMDGLQTSLVGFDMNGSVGGGKVSFYWNSSPIGGATQAHARGAVLREFGLSLLAQPVLFNNDFCIGLPTVTANEAGDLGFSMAFGGNTGGTGGAARGAVAISDDFSPGLGLVGSLVQTASGTANRGDTRYGDYFSARRHEPCSLWFTATNYALDGGAAVANVNSRYVEFGRGRYEKCYTRFKNSIGTP